MNPYDKIMNDWMNKQYEESMKYYTKMVYSYFGIPKDFDGRMKASRATKSAPQPKDALC